MDFDFNKIVDDMGKAFKLSKKEKDSIKKSPAFKILCAIPFIAKCEDPDRCAYLNLASLIVAARLGKHDVTSFRKADLDSIDKRLQYVFNFIGGNKAIIEQGKALLKLNMLLDYKKDFALDKKLNKDNPLNYPTFTIEKELEALETVSAKTEFDSLFDVSAQEAMKAGSFWMYG